MFKKSLLPGLVSLGAVLLLNSFYSHEQSPDSQPPNILFIAVDDLRPELGCYGKEYIKSPNIDRLAAQGQLFKNHFVAVPTCGASRHALLTGRHPLSKKYLSNNISAEVLSGKPETETPETFIHLLKRNQYYTVGIGKISHHPDGHVYGYLDSPKDAPLELPHSWNEMLLDDEKWGSGHNAFFGYADGTNRNTLKGQVKPYEAAAVDDEAYVDGLTAKLAVQKLGELKKREQPFVLAVGFFKPHLPFTAPKKYWDLYDEDKLPISPTPDIPENINKASLLNSGEFNNYQLGEEEASLDHQVSDAYARKLRHAYFASISYVDAQIGKVLDELEKQGLAENTIVVLWGDHGWQLGDYRVWGKHTCFERALHSPLIIKNPKMEKGIKHEQVVGTVDIYPTLMEFCGVTPPKNVDGSSLTNLMKKSSGKDWKNVAYSYFNNGITLRTPRYRLTKYFRQARPAIELYDHKTDPLESKNIAMGNPATVSRLMPLLEKGNTGLYD
ncbi:sulfatase [Persicitalea jodogahamensis]|uniref:Iduronate-2-sulfatase n=1 Tax=Persicitalea jodogahamensis TaxID=402147 RepID=A0A8J3GA49_9BACT|nr:sulfatase [Persicitalea jodogahamensis]GHB78090.1 iduronate-2-sulfatase [Persicitalea jodogahamensis]